MKRWYEFCARAKSAAEIVIYDEIGAFGIPAKAFLDELKTLGPVTELTVRINSPGGSVFDGVAIYNALKRHDAAITVWIDGIAASIASMIAMAGDEVVMPENTMLMLHDPSGLVLGTAADMRGMAEARGAVRRLRDPDPDEDDDQAGRAVRDSPARLRFDQEGVRRQWHPFRLPDRHSGWRRGRQSHAGDRPAGPRADTRGIGGGMSFMSRGLAVEPGPAPRAGLGVWPRRGRRCRLGYARPMVHPARSRGGARRSGAAVCGARPGRPLIAVLHRRTVVPLLPFGLACRALVLVWRSPSNDGTTGLLISTSSNPST